MLRSKVTAPAGTYTITAASRKFDSLFALIINPANM
jgi:hypothetical protein